VDLLRERIILEDIDQRSFETFLSISGRGATVPVADLFRVLRPWDKSVDNFRGGELSSPEDLVKFYEDVVGGSRE